MAIEDITQEEIDDDLDRALVVYHAAHHMRPKAKDGWFTLKRYMRVNHVGYDSAMGAMNKGLEEEKLELQKYKNINYYRIKDDTGS